MPRRRSPARKLLDLVTFPARALLLPESDLGPLSSLASERYDYVSHEVNGRCLDVGCGRFNRFIRDFRDGNGAGIDVHPYEGLTEENLVSDISRFPFDDRTFDTVTFIANLNHVPRSLRDVELEEAHRCLRRGGLIVVTMGNPVAEILAHVVVAAHDRLLGTRHDVDAERGMHEEEAYYLLDSEIVERLDRAGFVGIRKKRFWTQWGLNHLLAAVKP